jgi:hypothetical protein
MPGSVAEDLLARLSSPDAYPQNVDLVRATVLLLRFDQQAYRAASFLDDRILGPGSSGAWVPAGDVDERSRGLDDLRPLHFVFHTGHVGSTLLSRLLDETGKVLPLREPLPLRVLAETHDALGHPDALLSPEAFDRTLQLFLRLWRRGYPGIAAVVLKATSSTARLAGRLLATSDASRAVYLNLRPEPYLATILAGEHSPLDLRGHGPERVRRLQHAASSPLPALHTLSLGELAAMSWLAESQTRAEALHRFGERVLGLDFDQMLSDLRGTLARALAHLSIPAEPSFLAQVQNSAVLGRYSKAPEYEYSPALRAEVLRESRQINAAEIRRGMLWLERIARADAALGRVVEGSAG